MPQPRKNTRPRIDAVIRHVKAGSYDEDMGMLQGAIQDRNRVRQEAVLGLVKEVFGNEFGVSGPPEPNPPRPRPGGPIQRAEGEVLPGESPHVQQVDSEDDELGPDYESRSPVIGSIEDGSAQDQEAPADADPPDAS